MTKQTWMDVAEVVDAIRLVPRAMLVFFGVFYVWYIKITTQWYFEYLELMIDEKVFSVPAVAGSTAFVTGTITAIGAMVTWFAGNIYMKTGRQWGAIQKEEYYQLKDKIAKFHGTD